MTDVQARALRTASDLVGRELSLVDVFTGGQHAITLLATDGDSEFVVRAFPAHHDAAIREAEVLGRLSTLGAWAPHLVAANDDLADPVIVTSRVFGSAPGPDLSPMVIAAEMAAALVRIHDLGGHGLRPTPGEPPGGESALAARARREWASLDMRDPVLIHSDFWCGNALWEGGRLTGVVDWSGARSGPRGVDVAWCRQDLVLLGSPEAARLFIEEYERLWGDSIDDIDAWDVQAAARAHDRVETWLPNYVGIGRTDMTAQLLRERLDSWNATL
ncbi:phosphotransferase family protein [Brevibacterium marinum]|uniref:Aminoglycoside phosphotransferase (APT) family kinase protein n=1 Tax=Brevibacterium marinum TaxID=418643 RepID=A0A846RSX6_9MICO|nr:phosphotransferase [Brevibacterium marinum]NJC55076.1 aminoglycoside phosphotransferase (APT) family kinase protein [Brevibacterium marinum]